MRTTKVDKLQRLSENSESKAMIKVLDDICDDVFTTYAEARKLQGELHAKKVRSYIYDVSVNEVTHYYVVDTDTYPMNEIRQMIADETSNTTERALQEQLRLGRHSSVYQTADRILTNQDVTCVFNDSEQPFPAFNDGSVITFNTKVIDTSDLDSDEFLIQVTGLNYHEVAHLLWTPRQNCEFMKQVTANNVLIAFNILEDTRIEALLVSKYPSTVPFLLKATYDYFMDNQNPFMFAIIGGRTYLPKDLVDLLYQQFAMTVGEEVALEIVGIINRYRTLSLPKQGDEGLILIKRFAELLNAEGNGQLPQGEGDEGEGDEGGEGTPCEFPADNPLGGTPCSKRKPMKSGRPESGKKQDSIDKPSNYVPTDGTPNETTSEDSQEQGGQDFGNTGNSLSEVEVLAKVDDELVCEHLRSK